jgi:hypothetical protein
VLLHGHDQDHDHQWHRHDTIQHRRPEQRPDRIDTDEVDEHADQRGYRDRTVERLGIDRQPTEPSGLAQSPRPSASAADPAGTATASSPMPMMPAAKTTTAKSLPPGPEV